jgi:hypothetical protein
MARVWRHLGKKNLSRISVMLPTDNMSLQSITQYHASTTSRLIRAANFDQSYQPRCCWWGFMTRVCMHICSFGTMCLMRKATNTPSGSTLCHGFNIGFADLSEGCQLASAAPSLSWMMGYMTDWSLASSKGIHGWIQTCIGTVSVTGFHMFTSAWIRGTISWS